MNTIIAIFKIIKNIIKFANNHKYLSLIIIFLGSAPVSFLIRILKNGSKIVIFISGIVSSIATFIVPDPSDFILSSFTFVKDILKNGYSSIVDFIVNKLKRSTPIPEEKSITLKDLSDKIKFNSSKDEPVTVFDSLRAKYKTLTINGQKVDDSWLQGYYLYLTLFLITGGALFLVTICYMDETGVVKETVMKFTGLAAIHKFLFGRNGDDDPGDGLLPPLDQSQNLHPVNQPDQSWYDKMTRVMRDNSNNTPYDYKTNREPVHWRIGRLLGVNTEEVNRFSEDSVDQNPEVELNNEQTTNPVAGPSTVNESNTLGLTQRRNSFDDIPVQESPFADHNPLPSKGKNPEINRHFKNTSVNESNITSQTNRYFSLPVDRNEDSVYKQK